MLSLLISSILSLHNSGFVEAKGGDECGFPLVFLVNPDIIISPSDIKLGKQHGVLHVID